MWDEGLENKEQWAAETGGAEEMPGFAGQSPWPAGEQFTGASLGRSSQL